MGPALERHAAEQGALAVPETARELAAASNTRRDYEGALRRLQDWLDGRSLDDATLAEYLAVPDRAGHRVGAERVLMRTTTASPSACAAPMTGAKRLGSLPGPTSARGSLRQGEGRRRELVQNRGHAEAQRVVQRRAEAVHMAIDQPRDQRVTASVQAGQLLRQVEPRADAPDPPVLDPHVLVPLEGLTIEDCEVALCVALEGLARVWFPVVPACIWRTHEVEFEDFRTWE